MAAPHRRAWDQKSHQIHPDHSRQNSAISGEGKTPKTTIYTPGKGSRTDPKKRLKFEPSYIEQSYEQKGRAQRPSPHLHALIEADSDPARAWGAWLHERGFPPLIELSALHCQNGFDLPMRWPPSKDDTIGNLVAERVSQWAISFAAQASDCDENKRAKRRGMNFG